MPARRPSSRRCWARTSPPSARRWASTSAPSSTAGKSFRLFSFTSNFLRFKVNIWDAGGQRTLRPFWKNYYEDTDSLVWVVDATALDRLADCRAELHKVLTEDRLAGASLLVFVNKLDAIGSDEATRDGVVQQVEAALDLGRVSAKHAWKVLGCSAYDGTNLHEGLDWVVDEIRTRLFLLDE